MEIKTDSANVIRCSEETLIAFKSFYRYLCSNHHLLSWRVWLGNARVTNVSGNYLKPATWCMCSLHGNNFIMLCRMHTIIRCHPKKKVQFTEINPVCVVLLFFFLQFHVIIDFYLRKKKNERESKKQKTSAAWKKRVSHFWPFGILSANKRERNRKTGIEIVLENKNQS